MRHSTLRPPPLWQADICRQCCLAHVDSWRSTHGNKAAKQVRGLIVACNTAAALTCHLQEQCRRAPHGRNCINRACSAQRRHSSSIHPAATAPATTACGAGCWCCCPSQACSCECLGCCGRPAEVRQLLRCKLQPSDGGKGGAGCSCRDSTRSATQAMALSTSINYSYHQNKASKLMPARSHSRRT